MNNKKVIKPSLTTHKKIIGNIFYIFIEKTVNDLSQELKLTEKEYNELLDFIMTNSEKLFDYKTFNNFRNILL
jgi:hypothetical protein